MLFLTLFCTLSSANFCTRRKIY